MHNYQWLAVVTNNVGEWVNYRVRFQRACPLPEAAVYIYGMQEFEGKLQGVSVDQSHQDPHFLVDNRVIYLSSSR